MDSDVGTVGSHGIFSDEELEEVYGDSIDEDSQSVRQVGLDCFHIKNVDCKFYEHSGIV